MTELGTWDPLHPRELAGVLHALDVPWWIGGGWALDLFLGRETRPHEDTDLILLRRDALALQEALERWDLHLAAGGELRPWGAGEPVERPANAVWARRPGGSWLFDVKLEENEGDVWLYRRSDRVRRPIAELGLDLDGIPVLRPELVLLYKLGGTAGPHDDADLAAVEAFLPAESRAWLADALTLAHPQIASRFRTPMPRSSR